MKATFISFGDHLASSRLRASIPQHEVYKLGVAPGYDVVIYGKHWVDEDQLKVFGKRIFDICDDHFDNAHGDYYRRHCEIADLVTCNSVPMQSRIREETGREAILVREPYESEEHPSEIAAKLLWFGHQSNLKNLDRIKHELHYPLLCLTNSAGHAQWTKDSFKKAISSPCIVIIPTGAKQCKSENRMVEAIRNGRYVCAEPLPSYAPFNEFFPLGDIPSHIEFALSDPQAAINRIRAAQDYIRNKYSHEAIGREWIEVLKCL